MSSNLAGRAGKLSDRLLGLHRVSTALVLGTDEVELIHVVLREAGRQLEADSSGLYLWDEATQTLGLAHTWPERWPVVGERLEPGEDVAGLSWERQATLVINDYPSWRNARDAVKRAGVVAATAAPLQLSERCLGILVAWGTHPGVQFDLEDGLLLELLAAQTAAAIERARMQERLLRTEKLRAVGQLAAGAAHDFNNLLQLIAARVRSAREALIDERVASPDLLTTLDVIEKAIEEGSLTVERLQAFARTQHDRPPRAVPLRPLIEDVLELTRPRWQDEPRARGAAIGVSSRVEADLACAGQVAELSQALVNLVLNAIEAMPSGGELRISAERRGQQVRLRVSDTGVGMPESVRRQVFEPFFTTKGEQGTGLGLAMVYTIVRRHGGEIEVESEPGQGTTFTMTLPLANAEAGPASSHRPAAVSERVARVLVVDDDERLARLLGQMLEKLGHQVTTCTTAEAALDVCRRTELEVVFTDLLLEAANGRDLARRLKAIKPNLGVVLVTGDRAETDQPAAGADSVDVVLSKPYSVQQLALALEQALGDRGASRKRDSPPAAGAP